jgi:hypothetical protein
MATKSLPVAKTIAQPRVSRPLVAWLAVNFFDALLTYVLIGMGGIEGNPALAKLQTLVGSNGMLVAKLSLAAAVGLALTIHEKSHLIVLASRLMGPVVLYNAALIAYYVLPSMHLPFAF